MFLIKGSFLGWPLQKAYFIYNKMGQLILTDNTEKGIKNIWHPATYFFVLPPHNHVMLPNIKRK